MGSNGDGYDEDTCSYDGDDASDDDEDDTSDGDSDHYNEDLSILHLPVTVVFILDP